MIRIAVLDDYQQLAHECADWAALGADVRFFHQPMNEAELVAELADFDVLVLMRERTALPRRVLDKLARLSLVVTTGMANASVDADCLRERGVRFCGTDTPAAQAGVSPPTEVAWALIFATMKRLVVEDRAVRTGAWQLGLPSVLMSATLGLVGLGRLGAEMVAPAKAFGMNVIAWSQNLTAERAKEVGVTAVTKDELLRTSDVVSLHLKLSDRSRGLLGAGDLALMRPSAVLINISRGPLVDEQALIDALRARTIAAAGLDVYDIEPLPPAHPLLTLDNVVLSPHLGYANEQSFRAWYRQVVEDIDGHLNGRPIREIGER
jgi:phosphoglycerate dehydrogenase-like enzyme